MRKAIIIYVVLVFFSGSVFAVGTGYGARSVAMGGTGIATANDMTAAYYNPAGIMYGGENLDVQVFAGGTMKSIQDLMEASSDSSKFFENSFDQDIDYSATLNGGFGLSVRRVGISAFAEGYGVINHPASSLIDGTIYGKVTAYTPLTLGSTFATPGIPIASMSVGVNIKPITVMGGGLDVASRTQEKITGSGFGFDIGAQGKLTPLISLGAVVRNLSASVNLIKVSNPITIAPDGTITGGSPDTVKKYTEKPGPETGIGVGIVFPLTGTLIACDVENYSLEETINSNKKTSYNDIHLGLEQGFLFNIIMLRMGHFTYGPTKEGYLTYGLGINVGPASIGIAAANNQKTMSKDIVMAQLGVSF